MPLDSFRVGYVEGISVVVHRHAGMTPGAWVVLQPDQVPALRPEHAEVLANMIAVAARMGREMGGGGGGGMGQL